MPLAVMPILTKPSVVMLEDCKYPVQLPDTGLTVSQVEHLWLQDRGSLLSCGEAKRAVQDYYLTRDRRLTGNAGGGR